MTTEPLLPVAAAERVETIDILRGMALFGILAANMRGFAGPPLTYFWPNLIWPGLLDRIAQAIIDTFVQGKFIAIFAVLFGAGFAVQLERAASRGGRFGWIYARRLAILLLFGLIHGLLIWFGDILLTYALIGFFLLLFRKRTDKTLVVWIVIGLAIPVLLMTAIYLAVTFGADVPMPVPTATEIAKVRDIYASGTWVEILMQRMSDAVRYNWAYFLVGMWQIGALFLFGVLAWRKRFFQPAPESLPLYRRAMWWGLTIGAAGNAFATILRWALDLPLMPTTTGSFAAIFVQTIANPALSLGYICAVILLCHDDVWRRRLQRFGAVGRTALTNYLLQSVIGTLLFYSYGLALFGYIGPAALLPLTFAIFAVQVVLSVWWLERFRFGPVEWLWRSLTYGRRLPLTRERAVAPDVLPT
ncbi:MAG TPA: DUF418 domain-containing protein [Rhodothermia bacterium]|nr:DUF418 domain-containing protein [Rhodothermia bacterium]